jgi:3-deoxy-manno-octulosonate cytidylyltransferase (CMP-KDO synthetase)
MKTIVIIPARLKSSRLDKKVILELEGKPIVQHVYEQCLKAKKIKEVYIAVDNEEVLKICKTFTKNIIMTSEEHNSGTDRIAEAIKKIKCDNVINVQGDEPFINPETIDKLAIKLSKEKTNMVSVMSRIKTIRELKDHNVVKVIINKKSEAIYFSRSIIPHHRDEWEILLNKHKKIPKALNFYKHIGIYGYKKDFLLKYSKLQMTYLEKLEKLEQLRVIENGFKIKMIKIKEDTIGIDTIKDYKKAKKIIKKSKKN